MFSLNNEDNASWGDSSSSPSLVYREINVNKSSNISEYTTGYERKNQHSSKTGSVFRDNSKSVEGLWRENDLRSSQVMDNNECQVLYEKLKKYAKSWSYDVDSGRNSVGELDIEDDAYSMLENNHDSNQMIDSGRNSVGELGMEEDVYSMLENNHDSNQMIDSGRNSVGELDIEDDAYSMLENNHDSNQMIDSGITSPTDDDIDELDTGNTSDFEDPLNDYNTPMKNVDQLQDHSGSVVEEERKDFLNPEEAEKYLFNKVGENSWNSEPETLLKQQEESSCKEKQTSSYQINHETNYADSKWCLLNCSDEENRHEPKVLVRSTSLKSGKTPPGTPRIKKIVRFADVLGLDLEVVRHIGLEDDLPNIPASAFSDLKVPSKTEISGDSSVGLTSRYITLNTFAARYNPLAPSQSSRILTPLFPQPITQRGFHDRVHNQKVCLENIVVSDLNIHCYVRVLNTSFEKQVLARYTTNEWLSYEDILANYVYGSCDGFSDKFSWNFSVPHMTDGQRLIFAICYVAKNQKFWDNNDGKNYVLYCHGHNPGIFGQLAEETSSWIHHFM